MQKGDRMNYEDITNNYLFNICVSPDYQNPNPVNNIDYLYPEFKDLILQMLEEYERINLNDCPYIYETYRSHTLQNTYYYRGASKIRGGNILTAGMHHFGTAVDIINLEDKNGNKIKDKGEAVDWNTIDYKSMRVISRKLGIYDLGNYEVCHFQAIPVSEQSQLRRYIYNKVIQFQKEHNLVPDGIIGNKTINALKNG